MFRDRASAEAAAPTYDPAARYAIREGMELALLRAIQELPGRQRAVLIFRDVLGWTAPEVAEVLESTVASVNSARQRARSTIEEHLPDTARASADPSERDLLNRYVVAFEHADMHGLVALLREDALLRMPPQPSVSGGLEIARFLLETVAQGDLTRIRHTARSWGSTGFLTLRFCRGSESRSDARTRRPRRFGSGRDRRLSRPPAFAALRAPPTRSWSTTLLLHHCGHERFDQPRRRRWSRRQPGVLNHSPIHEGWAVFRCGRTRFCIGNGNS